MIVIVGPVLACQARRRIIWEELGGATHRKRKHLPDPGGLWWEKSRGSRNPNACCRPRGKSVRYTATSAIVGSHHDDCIGSGPAHLDSGVLGSAIRYSRQRGRVLSCKCCDLVRKVVHESVVSCRYRCRLRRFPCRRRDLRAVRLEPVIDCVHSVKHAQVRIGQIDPCPS